jgi:DNA-binding NtrC family response regulator
MRSNLIARESSSAPALTPCQTGFLGLIGKSIEIQKTIQQIQRIAITNVSVLIHGESGTGKELVAKAIHLKSTRANQSFVALNAASIPEGLVESELFGHEKGAYTGAVTRYQGKVQQANGGTLFLDEIGDLPTPSQAKLLRVIEERQFQMLGGSDVFESDFRLLTATHQNLGALIGTGRFREDLYFRLAVFEIDLPPLRQRKEDIPLLVNHFIADFQLQCASAKSISAPAMDTLLAYHWPGNIRELQNVIRRALLLCDELEIQPEHLSERIRLESRVSRQIPTNHESTKPCRPSAEKMEEIERKALTEAIERCRGNLSMAIRELQIGRGRLYRKLKKYDLMTRVQVKRKAV